MANFTDLPESQNIEDRRDPSVVQRLMDLLLSPYYAQQNTELAREQRVGRGKTQEELREEIAIISEFPFASDEDRNRTRLRRRMGVE